MGHVRSGGWATTSSDWWLSQYAKGFFFSTTSADFWKSGNNFFSTSSVNYWESAQWRWSTTSNDYWETTQTRWATTSASYFLSQNQGAAFSTTSANAFIIASTTIVKSTLPYTWSALQSFGSGASTSNLTISDVQNSLLISNATGVVSGTTTLAVNFGGTGSTTLGGILKGNGSGVIQSAIAGTDYLTGSGISGNCVKWGPSNTLADQLSPCGSGGGSGGGTWATTTPYSGGPLINHPLYTSDIVTIGGTATSSTTFVIFDPNTEIGYINGSLGIGTTSPSTNLAVAGSVLASRYTATSTLASVFPYASSTALTSTFGYFNTASTSNLYLSGTNDALLITDGAGKASGTTTLSVSFGGTGSTTLGGILAGAGGTIRSVNVAGPLSFSFNTLSMPQAGSGVDGYLSSFDYQLIHTATTTFSYPLTYNTGSNAVTFAATSTLYAGSAGQVLAFLNGKWIGTATSTFSSPLSFDAGANAVSIQPANASQSALPFFLRLPAHPHRHDDILRRAHVLDEHQRRFDLAIGKRHRQLPLVHRLDQVQQQSLHLISLRSVSARVQ